MKYRNGLNLYWKAIIIVNTITIIMLFLGILWDSRTEMKFPVDYEVKNVE
jgi:FtsZ-interacting cell division protein ZipA